METPESIAQWVINNRYPKSDKDKISDSEMFQWLVEKINNVKIDKDEDVGNKCMTCDYVNTKFDVEPCMTCVDSNRYKSSRGKLTYYD